MQKIIEIKQADITPGNEYNYMVYSESGIYELAGNEQNLFLVDKEGSENTNIVPCVWALPKTFFDRFPNATKTEDEVKGVESVFGNDMHNPCKYSNVSNITESTLLKAIAITAKPELIKEIQ